MTELVLDLADKVAGVGVRASYGEKVEVGDSTVLPVALGWYGFGGGTGTGTDQKGDTGEGTGGGGGGVSIPLGAYVGRPGGEVRFEPNLIGLLLVATPLVWVLGKSLRWIIRALKH
ncbi:hypothetical protein ET445_11200 [Agromyces protaetiae]|uniref:Sporulation protein n=1 Tax=Agromyces protaetiae TaxID=2509455 RepID=A0A4P6FH42_9MICO|nr:hypothetical protein [Agromyces protaetiae]QAY73829.1 hypothetical protein ET445_11200 [Agromyces protaetiae]